MRVSTLFLLLLSIIASDVQSNCRRSGLLTRTLRQHWLPFQINNTLSGVVLSDFPVLPDTCTGVLCDDARDGPCHCDPGSCCGTWLSRDVYHEQVFAQDAYQVPDMCDLGILQKKVEAGSNLHERFGVAGANLIDWRGRSVHSSLQTSGCRKDAPHGSCLSSNLFPFGVWQEGSQFGKGSLIIMNMSGILNLLVAGEYVHF